MQRTTKTLRIFSVLIYSLGILLGIGLAAVAVWSDLEASLFDISIRAEKSLSSLRCPLLITRDETGLVTARFENTGTRSVERAIRTHISQGFVTYFREERLQLPLAPGETASAAWTVSADDAAYGMLVLVRVNTLRQAPMPSQSSSCGILVLDIPWVRGAWLVAAWLLLALAGIVGGGWLWLKASRPLVGRRGAATVSMAAVAALVLAGLVAGLAGQWVLGVIILALFVLLMIAILAQLVLDS